MSEPWIWQAALLRLAVLTGALIVAREERRAGLRFGQADPHLVPGPEVARWLRRHRLTDVALIGVVLAILMAGLLSIPAEQVRQILETRSGWGSWCREPSSVPYHQMMPRPTPLASCRPPWEGE